MVSKGHITLFVEPLGTPEQVLLLCNGVELPFATGYARVPYDPAGVTFPEVTASGVWEVTHIGIQYSSGEMIEIPIDLFFVAEGGHVDVTFHGVDKPTVEPGRAI